MLEDYSLAVNDKIWILFKGLLSVRSADSPAIALGCSFLAIGALLKNIGFNFQQSVSSTFLLMHYLVN